MRKNKEKLSFKQVSPQTEWFDDNNTAYDTVVFVHGILGDKLKTWGKFPQLLHEDPELPKLAILQWGYKSGLVPANYHGIETESEGLISDLRLLTKAGEPIHVVAHSMGGLVTLRCITQAISKDGANAHPVDSISLITLMATPLKGSTLADLINNISKIKLLNLIASLLPRKQLGGLTTAGFVDKLQEDIGKYLIPVGTREQTPGESVTVQIVVGKDDLAVTRESAEGPFYGEPETLTIEGTHSTVKQPQHHNDSRYKALKTNLVKKLGDRLHNWALEWATCDISINSKLAAYRIAEQYEEQIQQCFHSCFQGRYLNAHEEDAVFTTFLRYATMGSYDPEAIVRMTVADFIVPNYRP